MKTQRRLVLAALLAAAATIGFSIGQISAAPVAARGILAQAVAGERERETPSAASRGWPCSGRRAGHELANLLRTTAGDGILPAHSSASSREGTSTTENP